MFFSSSPVHKQHTARRPERERERQQRHQRAERARPKRVWSAYGQSAHGRSAHGWSAYGRADSRTTAAASSAGPRKVREWVERVQPERVREWPHWQRRPLAAAAREHAKPTAVAAGTGAHTAMDGAGVRETARAGRSRTARAGTLERVRPEIRPYGQSSGRGSWRACESNCSGSGGRSVYVWSARVAGARTAGAGA